MDVLVVTIFVMLFKVLVKEMCMKCVFYDINYDVSR
jgi:hypothetical protein